ncbi:hypothetical protein F383_01037 [Gossypium arboreum]|uniref:Uncharacterized protein n=1 Tax=Gossypium arboreum TaxID=29729 RepID=A0A0B0MIG6_GOSAR|nr:hypothetical protein F383_19654 [Gossypium arboreum]KHG28903.1 hypothetical protein F383_01037 [Gossypium arboreum]
MLRLLDSLLSPS